VSLDIFLYVALAAGFVAGRWIQRRSPWIGHAATVTVAVLLFLLGDGLGTLPTGPLLAEIPLAGLFAVATLTVTLLMVYFLSRFRPTAVASPSEPQPLAATLLPPVAFVGALLIGVAVGRIGGSGPGPLTEYTLYVLLALVGFELRIDSARIRSAWVPLIAAATGGVVVALAFVTGGFVPPRAVLSTAFAFGWYSLAGPLTAAQLGPALGLFAFLANFLRENLTMLLSPWLGKRVRGEGLAAMGGATSMDTTLFFITRYGDREAGTMALATGIVLTTAAGLLVPLVLGLPWG
jgi:uncharacterized membrane protein YbjE (DUF340 family)